MTARSGDSDAQEGHLHKIDVSGPVPSVQLDRGVARRRQRIVGADRCRAAGFGPVDRGGGRGEVGAAG